MGNRLNYFQRLVGTAISFFCFGVGGFLLGFFVIPSVRLLSKDADAAALRIKWLIQKTFKIFVSIMHGLGVCKFTLTNANRIHEDGGCLILANHPSLIDVVVLISLYPQANCIVKEALWNNPFLKGVVKGAGYIPNSRPDLVLEKCRESLEKGDALVVFPEGTRTEPNHPISVQRGASRIALALQCPIRFVQIEMNPTTLTKSEKWYKIPHHRPQFRLQISEKLESIDFPDQTLPRPIAARRLTETIKKKLELPLP